MRSVQAVAPCSQQALRAEAIRYHHRLQRGVDPAAFGGEARVRGEQGAGADRLGEDQHVAGLHAAFAQNARGVVVDQSVDGKTERELFAFAGVAADQRAIGFVQHFERARHHLEQHVFHF